MAKKTEKKPSINRVGLEARVLSAFLLLEIGNAGVENIRPADLEELYKKIEELNKQAFEQDDEKAFAVVEKYGLDEISDSEQEQGINRLKERIARNRIVNVYKQAGYISLASGSTNECEMSSAQILATVMHNIGIKNADQLSEAVYTGTLDEKTVDELSAELRARSGMLKKNLAENYKTYLDQKKHNTAIELLADDIAEYMPVKKTVDFAFEVNPKDKDARKTVRQDFLENVKPDFLALYGTMMTEGRNVARDLTAGTNYARFLSIMEKYAGKENAQAEADLMLGISADQPDIETARKKAYREKCSEIYFKTVAGILSQKHDYNRSKNIFDTNWNFYLQTINDKYIAGLCNGYNDVGMLAFQYVDDSRPAGSKSEEYRLNSLSRKQMVDDKNSTVHHKFPISAVWDTYDQILPAYAADRKLEKCCKVANNFSNFVFVIGKEMHDKLEPQGIMKFGAKPNAMVFAANLNCNALKNIVRGLPPYLQQGINKYVPMSETEKSKNVSISMNFTEPKEISAIREKVQAGENKHISTLQKMTRYYERK